MLLTADEVVAAWQKAPRAAIHPAARLGDAAYSASGRVDCQRLMDAVTTRGTVLEYGCGDGRVTQHLAKRFNAVLAMDTNPTYLGSLADKGLPNVRCVLVGGQGRESVELTWAPDVCFSTCVFIHTPRETTKAILDSWHRHLAPGGLAAFQLPVYDAPRTAKGWTDVSVYTVEECRALAEGKWEILVLPRNPGVFTFGNVGKLHNELQVWRRL